MTRKQARSRLKKRPGAWNAQSKQQLKQRIKPKN